MRQILWAAVGVATLAVAVPSEAGLIAYTSLTTYATAGGTTAVGLDFDSVATGTNIGGVSLNGITFSTPAGSAPLIVVNGATTTTPNSFSGIVDPSTNRLFPTSGTNVLSPGGAVLGPGFDPQVENDDLEITFTTPVRSFGFDLLSQSLDGVGYIGFAVYNQLNVIIMTGALTISDSNTSTFGGEPGGANFFGFIATGPDLIGRIWIDEYDADASFPDANIGFDTFRYAAPTTVPEPGTMALLGLGALGVGVGRWRNGDQVRSEEC